MSHRTSASVCGGKTGSKHELFPALTLRVFFEPKLNQTLNTEFVKTQKQMQRLKNVFLNHEPTKNSLEADVGLHLYSFFEQNQNFPPEYHL